MTVTYFNKINMKWLFKENVNTLLKKKTNGKTNYLDKSVLSILGVLSRIRQENTANRGGIYSISSPVKFLFTILIIIFLALSRNLTFILLVDSYVLFMLSILDIKDIKKILSITIIVFIFSSILLTPSVFMGYFSNSLLITLKIIGSVMLLNILSYTTKIRNITRSLKFFFFPDLFILIIDMAIKYIIILGDFSINMLYAIKLRSVGNYQVKHTSLTNLLGILFLKSKEMAEETFYAMECRCFTGNYKSKTGFKFHLKDIIYIFINSVILALFFFIKKG